MWGYSHPKLMTFKQVQEKGRDHLRRLPDSFEKAVSAGRGSDMAVLSYTSGTTGSPKGCILTHSNLFDPAFRAAGAFQYRAFTQYLSYISPAWATEQWMGLTLGLLIPFVVNFPEEPETVQENIREIGVESMFLGPRQWESLAALVKSKIMEVGPIRRGFYDLGLFVGRTRNLALLEGRKAPLIWRMLYAAANLVVLRGLRSNLGLQSVAYPGSGGAAMAPDVFRFFHAIGVKLRNSYGTTEMGGLTTHQGEAFDLETVGQWMPVLPKFGPRRVGILWLL
jgi:long-chain acyl-CoA synthetase